MTAIFSSAFSEGRDPSLPEGSAETARTKPPYSVYSKGSICLVKFAVPVRGVGRSLQPAKEPGGPGRAAAAGGQQKRTGPSGAAERSAAGGGRREAGGAGAPPVRGARPGDRGAAPWFGEGSAIPVALTRALRPKRVAFSGLPRLTSSPLPPRSAERCSVPPLPSHSVPPAASPPASPLREGAARGAAGGRPPPLRTAMEAGPGLFLSFPFFSFFKHPPCPPISPFS